MTTLSSRLSSATPAPPQFYPVNLHPEFGYFCPRPALRQRARAAGKAMLVGAVLGAIGVLALTSHAPSPTQVVLAAHSAVPPATVASAPAVAIAASASGIVAAAMPDAFAGPCRANSWPYLGSGCLAPPAAPWEPMQAAELQADPAAAVPTPPLKQGAPATRKVQKVKRERRQEQDLREPDPRTAYAARHGDPRQRFDDRGGIFGTRTGWGGGFGGGGWSW